MTVGETLTEARSQAGLSVEQLSERTKIRGTVIRSIEEDDFEACGGDLYVRGYMRAIAGAIGIDAQPLIREFDAGRRNGTNERANGSTGRYARSYPSAAPPAETAFDLPAIPTTKPPAKQEEPAKAEPKPDAQPNATADANPAPAADAESDLSETRFDMLAVTSFDLPLVPGALPSAANDADQTAQLSLPDFPAAGQPSDETLDPDFPVPSSTPAPVPPAAVPPGSEDTRFDIPVAAEDDVPTAAIPATPAGTADAGTQVLPAITSGSAPEPATAVWSAAGMAGQGPGAPVPVGAAPEGKKRRGLVTVAALAALIAVAGVGFHFATGKSGTTAGTPAASASAASASTSTNASASGVASASSGTSPSASGSPKSSVGDRNVASLPIASVAAFGPGGLSGGDDQADAGNAIAADPAHPWATQWYATPAFGGLKVGTGLLFNMKNATVTSVHLDLAPQPGGTLEVLVGDTATPGTFTVEATTSDISGATTVTLRHPVAARYLLIWFTQLPANGQGHYMESVSGVTVTGRS